MALQVTIEFKTDDQPETHETRGLHAALGYVEDCYSRAKDGSGPEIARAIVEDSKEA